MSRVEEVNEKREHYYLTPDSKAAEALWEIAKSLAAIEDYICRNETVTISSLDPKEEDKVFVCHSGVINCYEKK